MPLDPIAAGSSQSYPLRVMRSDGVTPSTAFVSTDVLAVDLWAGDDRAESASPTAAWDPVPPEYRVTFAPPDTAALVPGTYRLRVTATRGADTVEIYRDSIEVMAVAGVGAEPRTYCTYQDMAVQCSWIGQFLDTAEDQSGFAEERAQARDWLDGLVLSSQPTGGGFNLISRQHSWSWTAPSSTPFLGSYAYDAGLKAALDNGGLVTAGPAGRQAVRACALYAVALVLGAQPDESSRKHAAHYMRRATSEASTAVVEVTGGYAIPLGVTNTRYG